MDSVPDSDSDSLFHWRGTPVTRRSLLAGLGAVSAFVAVDIGAVAYAKDWVTTGATLTRQTFLDGFRTVYGSHPGFRRNHAKGVAVTGFFDSTGRGGEISRAAVFRAGRTPVTGRFSLAGGNPFGADDPATARGLALAFDLPEGRQWRTAMLNTLVFPDRSPRGFYDRLVASKVEQSTGKPDPDRMRRFYAEHPETVAAVAVNKTRPPSTGFADSTFSSLNAFYLVDGSGRRTPVRWTLVPEQAARPPRRGDNGLFDAVVRQIQDGALRWRMLLTIGEPGDPIDDATLPWPPERRQLDAGTVVLTAAHTEAAGNVRDVNFDPLVLPDGIEPSEDPLLSARSAVYAGSYRARTGEAKSPSAIQVEDVAR
ncbi:catalase family peroxidase [Mycobacterium sp. WMMD1722]|uniref:catalase family peroxidase n=1 Tax=Mycobacterium sp. WMMD1722 TaxID=3404117 RepID=UPI003BF5AD3F